MEVGVVSRPAAASGIWAKKMRPCNGMAAMCGTLQGRLIDPATGWRRCGTLQGRGSDFEIQRADTLDLNNQSPGSRTEFTQWTETRSAGPSWPIQKVDTCQTSRIIEQSLSVTKKRLHDERN